jgi:hypothetical protein
MTVASKLRLALTGAVFGLSVMFGADCAYAQNMPSKEDQELLVKTTLLTFNDANLTGDYSVLRAKSSKPFRDKFDEGKLKEIFKDFVDKKVDISIVAIKPAIPSADGAIDKNSVLKLSGSFATQPKILKYELEYSVSEGVWKTYGIHVSTE